MPQKGMYVKAGSPKEAQEAVLNYYFGENNDNGMYIGYHLYHKYGITEEKKVMLSNSIPINDKADGKYRQYSCEKEQRLY